MYSDLERDFSKQGYIISSGDSTVLIEIREIVSRAIFAELAAAKVAFQQATAIDGLHKLRIDSAVVNALRVATIRRLAEENVNELIFRAFKSIIVRLLGPDLLVQKHTNLVIQVPGDPNPSELHRDSPPNSEYELVAWVPLVDIDARMAMYILGLSDSMEAKRSLTDAQSWAEFKRFSGARKVLLPIRFGDGLFFWTGLFHGSEINCGERTRISLNIRFKAVGTPFGDKAAAQFFRLLSLSPLTRMALESEIKR